MTVSPIAPVDPASSSLSTIKTYLEDADQHSRISSAVHDSAALATASPGSTNPGAGAMWQEIVRDVMAHTFGSNTPAFSRSVEQAPPSATVPGASTPQTGAQPQQQVKEMVDQFREAANRAAITSLAVTVPQTAVSSLKRIHQGQ